jgi:hypothetical protein
MQLLKPETLKLIAGATIVLTAACIMLQQILGYVFSLARLGLIIVIAVVVSSGLAFAFQFLVKRNSNKKESPVEGETSKTEGS